MRQHSNEIGYEGRLAERRALRKRITTLLRRFYKAVIDKGVPERFAGLVKRSESREPSKPDERKSAP